MKRKILVIYRKFRFNDRRTIKDHLYSFKKYCMGCDFYYLDLSKPWMLTDAIIKFPFDVVIFHYTFLVQRMSGEKWEAFYRLVSPRLSALQGVKVLVPHDEYSHTKYLWQLIQDCDVSTVFTSAYPQDYDTIFARDKVGNKVEFKTVLTGYVEESILPELEAKALPIGERKIVVGYRGMRSRYLFGKHGQLKTQIAEEFLKKEAEYPHLRFDVALTEGSTTNILFGKKWFAFLSSLQTVIGCLGGSSLLDADGSVGKKVRNYLEEHPNATYEDISKACYENKDEQITGYLLGPRHLEAAMTKTCQLLVKGDYHGILEPNVHYIPIEQDFSNIDEVLTQIQDVDYCQKIADRCYEDVVFSGKYSYKMFAEYVMSEAFAQVPVKTNAVSENKLKFHFWCISKNPIVKLGSIFPLCIEAFVNVSSRLIKKISPKLYRKTQKKLFGI